MTSLWSVP
ncbi:hypothetical protein V3C99_003411 [Haemonchus contortus]